MTKEEFDELMMKIDEDQLTTDNSDGNRRLWPIPDEDDLEESYDPLKNRSVDWKAQGKVSPVKT